MRPGEISRAHRGILFLDELAEFARPVLEGLRQPLEEREVRLRRAGGWALFPANILLVAACNPCPCGWATHPRRPCTCPPHRLQSYRARLSGPLLDRFDLFVEMGPSPPEVLDAGPTSPTSEEAQHRLHRALDLQQARQGAGLVGPAGQMERPQLEASGLTPAARQRLRAAAAALDWSGRAALRSLRVARTLADLEASESVEEHHVLQAISFRRPMDLPEPERATGPRPPFA